jgi:hypothetical protein
MQRVKRSTAISALPAPPAGGTPGYFTSGNPGAGQAATVPGYEWFNGVQEEIMAVIEGQGLVPSSTDNTLLRQAIAQMILTGASSASIQGAYKNLQASATGSSANISVSADELVVESSAYAYHVLRGINATIAGTTAGANGLDTGALAASTWYSVWIIWNGTTTAGLLSLSATAPTIPSGYTHKARVGWIRTDGTGNKYPLGFKQYGRSVQYVVAACSNLATVQIMASGSLGNISTPTWVAVATGNYIPPTAAKIKLSLGGGSGSTVSIAAPNNAYSGYGSTTNPPPISTNGSQQMSVGEFVVESSNCYYASSSGANGYLTCLGWEDNL